MVLPWKTFLFSGNQKQNTKQTTNQNIEKTKKQNTKKQKIYQKNKNKQNRFNNLCGAVFLWVFGLGLRVAPQTRSEGSRSICFQPCKSKPPILEPRAPNAPKATPPFSSRKGGGCFGGLSKQRPCVTQECSLGPKNQKTKAPRRMLAQFCFFGFLVLWFFGLLVCWFFGSLVFWFWFYCGEGYISKPKKNKKTKKITKKQKKQITKKTKKTKNPKTNKPKLFRHSPSSFGFLVFWFRSSGGSSLDTFGGLKLDIPEKARTRRWERCFEGDGLSWGGVTINIYTYI